MVWGLVWGYGGRPNFVITDVKLTHCGGVYHHPMDAETVSIELGKAQAKVRKANAAGLAEADTKVRVCSVCSREFTAHRKDKLRPCPDCCADKVAMQGIQASRKSGPGYEKAALGQYRFWSAEVRRLGLSTIDEPLPQEDRHTPADRATVP